MKLSSLWDISFSRDKRDKEGIEREGGSFKNWNVNICSIIDYPRALRPSFTCYDQDYTQTVGVLIDILPHQMRHQHSPLRWTFFRTEFGVKTKAVGTSINSLRHFSCLNAAASLVLGLSISHLMTFRVLFCSIKSGA